MARRRRAFDLEIKGGTVMRLAMWKWWDGRLREARNTLAQWEQDVEAWMQANYQWIPYTEQAHRSLDASWEYRRGEFAAVITGGGPEVVDKYGREYFNMLSAIQGRKYDIVTPAFQMWMPILHTRLGHAFRGASRNVRTRS